MGNVPPQIERELKTFYHGQVCVVTGDLIATWHHLDENRLRRNNTFSNIVPLNWNLNCDGIEGERAGWQDELPKELKAGTLEDTASQLVRVMLYARAYACARIGAFIQLNHTRDYNWCLRFSAAALRYVRPLARVDLATDTLSRNVLVALQGGGNDVRPSRKAVIAQEIGSYFRDHGWLPEAICWAETIAERWSKLEGLEPVDAGRLEQQVGIAKLGLGDADALKSLDMGLELLSESPNPTLGESTHLLWLTRYYLARRDLIRAKKTAEAAEGIHTALSEPETVFPGATLKGFTPWTLQEWMWTKVDLYRALGEEGRAARFEREAIRLQGRTQIEPTAVLRSESTTSRIDPVDGKREPWPDRSLTDKFERAARDIEQQLRVGL